MMEQPTKKQKVEETTSSTEAVLFNSDALSKIISYLPSVDVLNLALTCKRFGVSNTTGDKQTLIEKSAHIAVQDLATAEQLAALPHYEGESSLADYHYLQLLRETLSFDQLTGGAEYVNEDKSCVRNYDVTVGAIWHTALSNNILRAGKHYASFILCNDMNYLFVGVMRPGQANKNARGIPTDEEFYQHFSRNIRRGEHNNGSECCLYISHSGRCLSSDWDNSLESSSDWEGRGIMSPGDEVGMLLDLDEGTLSVYQNGKKLGVMKKGLAGQFCWVVSLHRGMQVSMKRGSIPS